LAALEVAGLNASYGRARILVDVAFELAHGEVAVLLGRNGAGKSTTLKAVMGLLRADSGEVRLGGRRIDGLEPFEIARLGVGYVPEDRRIFADLTVQENIEVGRRPGEWSIEKVFGLFPVLKSLRDRPAARTSGGEQQMLAIARALVGNPSVLLLDEPAEGLAPRVVAEMAQAILELKRAGLAVLLCEQNLPFAERVGDRAFLLEQGRVRRHGAVRDMRENLFS
jgi:branched-chain amino acid transport system ATP-binding protein